MVDNRSSRAKRNIYTSLVGQIVAIFCGFVMPRLMIGTFGSEAYGATTSISQFLAYITLLEGGIGGVARAALYKPLADNDHEKIGLVVGELRRFFKVIAYIFLVYVLVLASTFKIISDVELFDWLTTFLLVVVISISTFAQYYIGITYSVLLQAAQQTYITNYVTIGATVLNTVMTVVLVKLGCSLLMVKLVSGCIFVMRPVVLQMYVKRKYDLIVERNTNEVFLKDKWTGLGQHIAFFLHSNTDIMVLTILADLRMVAVYSVYQMIIAQLQNLVVSFSSGMEALFGELIAKEEWDELKSTFTKYEMLISIVAMILFTTAAILIIPFVKLYTAGITDVEYIVPTFALLMIISSVLYCMRVPYHAVTIAAGHFRQTKFAAYGEAVVNISLSVILVARYGLIGVAIGTILATSFRFLYYVIYLSRNILHQKITCVIKRFTLNSLTFSSLFVLGKKIVSRFSVDGYVEWVLFGVITVMIVSVVTVACNGIVYRDELISVLKNRKRR